MCFCYLFFEENVCFDFMLHVIVQPKGTSMSFVKSTLLISSCPKSFEAALYYVCPSIYLACSPFPSTTPGEIHDVTTGAKVVMSDHPTRFPSSPLVEFSGSTDSHHYGPHKLEQ